MPHDMFHDGWNRVPWRDQVLSNIRMQHRNIVKMVSCNKYLVSAYLVSFGNFSNQGAFMDGGMAESGVNIVANPGKIGVRPELFVNKSMNQIGILIASRNQADRRMFVLINMRIKFTIDPFADFKHQAGILFK